jgi:hypothetical protein
MVRALNFAARDPWVTTGPWKEIPAFSVTMDNGTVEFQPAEEHQQKWISLVFS